MRILELTIAAQNRAAPPYSAPTHPQRPVACCRERAGLLMVLRVTVQRCSTRSRRFIGLSSRSSISATAASSQCQQPLHRNNDRPQTLTSRHLPSSSYYSRLRPPPSRPPSRCVVDGSTAERLLSTWSSGGVDIASVREHPSHKQGRHHSTCSGNRTPGTRTSLPQLPPTCARSNRTSSASSIRSNSTNSGGGGGDGVSKSESSSSESSALLKMLGPRWSPYGRLARIDKPAGTLLLLFPCWWSIALAAPMHTLPDLKLMALFATGALVMR